MTDRIERLTDFLKQSPDDLFLNHAMALEYVKIGDETQAELFFLKNLNYDLSHVPTYYHLGKLMERTGRQDEAIKIYEQGMTQAKAVKDNHSYNELQAAYEDLVY